MKTKQKLAQRLKKLETRAAEEKQTWGELERNFGNAYPGLAMKVAKQVSYEIESAAVLAVAVLGEVNAHREAKAVEKTLRQVFKKAGWIKN